MPMSIWRRAFNPLSIGALSLLVVMLFSLWANRDCLEIGTDGAGWQTYIDYQVHDRAPFSQLGVDAHQGDFDAYYPLDNDFTPPGALYRLLGRSEPPGPVANTPSIRFSLPRSCSCWLGASRSMLQRLPLQASS